MQFLGAGKTRNTDLRDLRKNPLKECWKSSDLTDVYHSQMRELADFAYDDDKGELNEKYRPFLFVDPRRMKEEGSAFFDYEFVDKKIVLKPCFIKRYMEAYRFSGFKIYPALGYYPFDKRLLPLWLYAVQNQIPIMTHCSVGPIYYRGKKEEEWNTHPIFKEQTGDDVFKQMLLPEKKHKEFQKNFTHPLNYACLVDELLLREWIKNLKDDNLKKIFGFTDMCTPLERDLSNLKICLAHMGGAEQWIRYYEQDTNSYSQRLFLRPNTGISIHGEDEETISWNVLYNIWHTADWYSIILTLMIHYPFIYGDISYTLSKEEIHPLLLNTLQKGDKYAEQRAAYIKESDPVIKEQCLKGRNKIRHRILYGTDFYVVRNQKSDKNLFIEMKNLLSEEEFDLISRENTYEYLERKYPNL
jgi:predicted TIM-barrel fold metal-dependent hydrolase